MADSGYSGTPLVKKLGLKDGQQVLFVNLPEHLGDLKTACAFSRVDTDWPLASGRIFDVIHWFGTGREALEAECPRLFSSVTPDGAVWISWPKKSSRVATTITEDVLRTVLLPTGLVDTKVCAVDEIWSGLKFMIRKELRSGL